MLKRCSMASNSIPIEREGTREGWLNKFSEGRLGFKWQRRFFVLGPNFLRFLHAQAALPSSLGPSFALARMSALALIIFEHSDLGFGSMQHATKPVRAPIHFSSYACTTCFITSTAIPRPGIMIAKAGKFAVFSTWPKFRT